jgi:hypothetical protein
MTVWNREGEIQIQFSSMHLPPFNQPDRRRDLADRLQMVPGSRNFSNAHLNSWPTLKLGHLVQAGGVKQFLEVWDWFLEQHDL